MMTQIQWQSDQIEAAEDADLIELCYQNGWTDGLPVVPPTPDRVEKMLAGTDRQPDELLAAIPPKWGHATIERIAINAVMAGCKPEYMPVVVAALEAVIEEAFNLHGVQVTTADSTPLLIINGPIRKQLDLNDSFNVFGQGWRANATIGRTIRLIGTNIGGALPGELDRSTLGHAGKYTFCIAEREEASLWQPLHVERGFQPSDSTVTVHAGSSPYHIGSSRSTAESVLNTICQSISALGPPSAEIVLVFSLEHMKTIARDGFSKSDIHAYIHEQTQRLPENVISIVAGGPAGQWTVAIPRWGGPTHSVTKRIEV